MKITPREKRRHAAGREKNEARVAISREGSTIPEEKWGLTRNIVGATMLEIIASLFHVANDQIAHVRCIKILT